jgi:hypothetical protein
MQKVKEAKSMWSKSKGKAKGKADNTLVDEAWRDELEILKAKRMAIQAMIDWLEG